MKKTIALFVSISFTVFNTFYGLTPNSWAETTSGEGIVSRFPLVEQASSQILPNHLEKVALPAGLGSIQESFHGKSGKTVIFIQDAHAIADAQKSIQSIIDYFQTQYGIQLITMEGGSGRLDPLLFKSYPSPERLKNVLGDYLTKGEISGAAAASVLNGQESAYYGVDDLKLYEGGLIAFQEALKVKPEFTAEITRRQAILDAQKEKTYSPQMLELDKLFKDFWHEKSGVLPLIQKLAGIKEPTGFPRIEALMKEIAGQNQKAELKEAQSEVKVLAGKIKLRVGDRSESIEFNKQAQAYATAQTEEGAFGHFLLELASQYGLDTSSYAALKKFCEHYPILLNLQGSELFEELERYIHEVKSSLLQNDEARKLDELNDRLRLLVRLANLELTKSEWLKFQVIVPHAAQLDFPLEPHMRFYESAVKRDRAFLSNILTLMQKEKTPSAVFLSGGFHTEGVKEALEKEGISYLLITPHMNQLPDDNPYLRVMQGDVSWKKYFEIKNGRVNLYDAFARGTVERLAQAGEAQDLKSWRDEIVRNLAARGQIARAGEYTRFIDELALRKMSPEELAALQAGWRKKFDGFLKRLEELVVSGKVTDENLLYLFQHPATMQGTGVMSLRPFATLDARAIGFASEAKPDRQIHREEVEMVRGKPGRPVRSRVETRAQDYVTRMWPPSWRTMSPLNFSTGIVASNFWNADTSASAYGGWIWRRIISNSAAGYTAGLMKSLSSVMNTRASLLALFAFSVSGVPGLTRTASWPSFRRVLRSLAGTSSSIRNRIPTPRFQKGQIPGSWRIPPQSGARNGHGPESNQDSNPFRQFLQVLPRLQGVPAPHTPESGSPGNRVSRAESEGSPRGTSELEDPWHFPVRKPSTSRKQGQVSIVGYGLSLSPRRPFTSSLPPRSTVRAEVRNIEDNARRVAIALGEAKSGLRELALTLESKKLRALQGELKRIADGISEIHVDHFLKASNVSSLTEGTVQNSIKLLRHHEQALITLSRQKKRTPKAIQSTIDKTLADLAGAFVAMEKILEDLRRSEARTEFLTVPETDTNMLVLELIRAIKPYKDTMSSLIIRPYEIELGIKRARGRELIETAVVPPISVQDAMSFGHMDSIELSKSAIESMTELRLLKFLLMHLQAVADAYEEAAKKAKAPNPQIRFGPFLIESSRALNGNRNYRIESADKGAGHKSIGGLSRKEILTQYRTHPPSARDFAHFNMNRIRDEIERRPYQRSKKDETMNFLFSMVLFHLMKADFWIGSNQFQNARRDIQGAIDNFKKFHEKSLDDPIQRLEDARDVLPLVNMRARSEVRRGTGVPRTAKPLGSRNSLVSAQGVSLELVVPNSAGRSEAREEGDLSPVLSPETAGGVITMIDRLKNEERVPGRETEKIIKKWSRELTKLNPEMDSRQVLAVTLGLLRAHETHGKKGRTLEEWIKLYGDILGRLKMPGALLRVYLLQMWARYFSFYLDSLQDKNYRQKFAADDLGAILVFAAAADKELGELVLGLFENKFPWPAPYQFFPFLWKAAFWIFSPILIVKWLWNLFMDFKQSKEDSDTSAAVNVLISDILLTAGVYLWFNPSEIPWNYEHLFFETERPDQLWRISVGGQKRWGLFGFPQVIATSNPKLLAAFHDPHTGTFVINEVFVKGRAKEIAAVFHPDLVPDMGLPERQELAEKYNHQYSHYLHEKNIPADTLDKETISALDAAIYHLYESAYGYLKSLNEIEKRIRTSYKLHEQYHLVSHALGLRSNEEAAEEFMARLAELEFGGSLGGSAWVYDVIARLIHEAATPSLSEMPAEFSTERSLGYEQIERVSAEILDALLEASPSIASQPDFVSRTRVLAEHLSWMDLSILPLGLISEKAKGLRKKRFPEIDPENILGGTPEVHFPLVELIEKHQNDPSYAALPRLSESFPRRSEVRRGTDVPRTAKPLGTRRSEARTDSGDVPARQKVEAYRLLRKQAEEKQEEAWEIFKEGNVDPDAEGFYWEFTRSLFSHLGEADVTPEMIAAQVGRAYGVFKKSRQTSFTARVDISNPPGTGRTEVIVVAPDKRGLLAAITQVLTRVGANIVRNPTANFEVSRPSAMTASPPSATTASRPENMGTTRLIVDIFEITRAEEALPDSEIEGLKSQILKALHQMTTSEGEIRLQGVSNTSGVIQGKTALLKGFSGGIEDVVYNIYAELDPLLSNGARAREMAKIMQRDNDRFEVTLEDIKKQILAFPGTFHIEGSEKEVESLSERLISFIEELERETLERKENLPSSAKQTPYRASALNFFLERMNERRRSHRIPHGSTVQILNEIENRVIQELKGRFRVATSDLPEDSQRQALQEEARRFEEAVEQVLAKLRAKAKGPLRGLITAIEVEGGIKDEIKSFIEQRNVTAEEAIMEIIAPRLAGMKTEYGEKVAGKAADNARDIEIIFTNVYQKLRGGEEIRGEVISGQETGSTVLLAHHLNVFEVMEKLAEFPDTRLIVVDEGTLAAHWVQMAMDDFNVPTVILPAGSLEQVVQEVGIGGDVIVNATTGEVFFNPSEQTLIANHEQKENEEALARVASRHAPESAIAKTGQRIYVRASADNPDQAQKAVEGGAEGIGLFRTEYLFKGNILEAYLKDPSPQNREALIGYFEFAFLEMASKMKKGEFVTIRTFDLQRDKDMGFPNPKEYYGPAFYKTFLGRELLRIELVAMLRANARSDQGKVRILFPMFQSPQDLAKYLNLENLKDLSAQSQAKLDRLVTRYVDGMNQILDEAVDEAVEVFPRREEKIKGTRRGFMLETIEGIRILPHILKRADFISMGTSDMVLSLNREQKGISRDRSEDAHYFTELKTNFLQTVRHVLQQISQWNGSPDKFQRISADFCGVFANHDGFLGFLHHIAPANVEVGVSRPPSGILGTKQFIREIDEGDTDFFHRLDERDFDPQKAASRMQKEIQLHLQRLPEVLAEDEKIREERKKSPAAPADAPDEGNNNLESTPVSPQFEKLSEGIVRRVRDYKIGLGRLHFLPSTQVFKILREFSQLEAELSMGGKIINMKVMSEFVTAIADAGVEVSIRLTGPKGDVEDAFHQIEKVTEEGLDKEGNVVDDPTFHPVPTRAEARSEKIKVAFSPQEKKFIKILKKKHDELLPAFKDSKGDAVETLQGYFVPSDIEMTSLILKKVLKGGEHFVDLGSGSGVVLFLAAVLGASHVTGFESDPTLYETSQKLLAELTQDERIRALIQGRIGIKQEDFMRVDFSALLEPKGPLKKTVFYYFDSGARVEFQDKKAFLKRLESLPPDSLVVIHLRTELTDEDLSFLKLEEKIPHGDLSTYVYHVPPHVYHGTKKGLVWDSIFKHEGRHGNPSGPNGVSAHREHALQWTGKMSAEKPETRPHYGDFVSDDYSWDYLTPDQMRAKMSPEAQARPDHLLGEVLEFNAFKLLPKEYVPGAPEMTIERPLNLNFLIPDEKIRLVREYEVNHILPWMDKEWQDAVQIRLASSRRSEVRGTKKAVNDELRQARIEKFNAMFERIIKKDSEIVAKVNKWLETHVEKARGKGMIRTHEDAEDIHQTIAANLFALTEPPKDFRGDGEPEGYLWRIIHHTSVNYYRRHRPALESDIKRKSAEDAESIFGGMPERETGGSGIALSEISGLSGLGSAILRERARDVRKAIVELPQPYRGIMELKLQGFNQREIAEKLGYTSKGAISENIAAAERALKANLRHLITDEKAPVEKQKPSKKRVKTIPIAKALNDADIAKLKLEREIARLEKQIAVLTEQQQASGSEALTRQILGLIGKKARLEDERAQLSQRSEVRSNAISLEEAKDLIDRTFPHYKGDKKPSQMDLFHGAIDLRYSYDLSKEILKHNIQKILVVGDGLTYFPYLMALMGKEIVILDRQKTVIELHEARIREIQSLVQDKIPGFAANIRLIQSEIGELDLDREGIQKESFDLVALIDLLGVVVEPENGNPAEWIAKVRELLKPEAYLLYDQSDYYFNLGLAFFKSGERMSRHILDYFTVDEDFGRFRGTYDEEDHNNLIKVSHKPRSEARLPEEPLGSKPRLRGQEQAETRNQEMGQKPPREDLIGDLRKKLTVIIDPTEERAMGIMEKLVNQEKFVADRMIYAPSPGTARILLAAEKYRGKEIGLVIANTGSAASLLYALKRRSGNPFHQLYSFSAEIGTVLNGDNILHHLNALLDRLTGETAGEVKAKPLKEQTLRKLERRAKILKWLEAAAWVTAPDVTKAVGLSKGKGTTISVVHDDLGDLTAAGIVIKKEEMKSVEIQVNKGREAGRGKTANSLRNVFFYRLNVENEEVASRVVGKSYKEILDYLTHESRSKNRAETRTTVSTDGKTKIQEAYSKKTRIEKLQDVRLLWEGENASRYGELKHLIHQYRDVLGMRHLIVRMMAAYLHGTDSSFREAAGELFILQRLIEHLGSEYKIEVLWLGLYVGFREFDFAVKITPREGVEPIGPALREGLYIVEAKEDSSNTLQVLIDKTIDVQVPHQIRNAALLMPAGIPLEGIIVAAGGKNSSGDRSRKVGSLKKEEKISSDVPVYSMVVRSFDVKNETTGFEGSEVPNEEQIRQWSDQKTAILSLVRNVLGPHFGVFPLLREDGEKILEGRHRLHRIEVERQEAENRQKVRKEVEKKKKMADAEKRANEADGWTDAFEKANVAATDLIEKVLDWYFRSRINIPPKKLRDDLHEQYWQSLDRPGTQQASFKRVQDGLVQEEEVVLVAKGSISDPQKAWSWLFAQYEAAQQKEDRVKRVAKVSRPRLPRKTPEQQYQETLDRFAGKIVAAFRGLKVEANEDEIREGVGAFLDQNKDPVTGKLRTGKIATTVSQYFGGSLNPEAKDWVQAWENILKLTRSEVRSSLSEEESGAEGKEFLSRAQIVSFYQAVIRLQNRYHLTVPTQENFDKAGLFPDEFKNIAKIAAEIELAFERYLTGREENPDYHNDQNLAGKLENIENQLSSLKNQITSPAGKEITAILLTSLGKPPVGDVSEVSDPVGALREKMTEWAKERKKQETLDTLRLAGLHPGTLGIMKITNVHWGRKGDIYLGSQTQFNPREGPGIQISKFNPLQTPAGFKDWGKEINLGNYGEVHQILENPVDETVAIVVTPRGPYHKVERNLRVIMVFKWDELMRHTPINPESKYENPYYSLSEFHTKGDFDREGLISLPGTQHVLVLPNEKEDLVLSWSLNGQKIIAVTEDGKVIDWDTSKNVYVTRYLTIPKYNNKASIKETPGVSLSPGGNFAALVYSRGIVPEGTTENTDPFVEIRDLVSEKIVAKLDHTAVAWLDWDSEENVIFEKFQKREVISSEVASDGIYRWAWNKGLAPEKIVRTDLTKSPMQISPDGRFLAFVDRGRFIRIVDLQSLKEVKADLLVNYNVRIMGVERITDPISLKDSAIGSLSWSPDSSHIAAGHDGRLAIWQVASPRAEARIVASTHTPIPSEIIKTTVRSVLLGDVPGVTQRAELREMLKEPLAWRNVAHELEGTARRLIANPEELLMPVAMASPTEGESSNKEFATVRSLLENNPYLCFPEPHWQIDPTISLAIHAGQLPNDFHQLKEISDRFLRDNHMVIAFNPANPHERETVERFAGVVVKTMDPVREARLKRSPQPDTDIPYEELKSRLPLGEGRKRFFAAMPVGTLQVSKPGVSAYEIDEKVLSALGLVGTLNVLLLIESAPERLRNIYRDQLGLTLDPRRGVSNVGTAFLDALLDLAHGLEQTSQAA